MFVMTQGGVCCSCGRAASLLRVPAEGTATLVCAECAELEARPLAPRRLTRQCTAYARTLAPRVPSHVS